MSENKITGFELSPQQKRCWNLRVGDTHPISVLTVKLNLKLDKEQLTLSIAKVLSRHDILRTVFLSYEGLAFPLQKVGDEASALPNFTDAENLSSEEKEKALRSFLQTEARLFWDLEKAHNLSIEILQYEAENNYFKICCPSLVADTYSLQLVLFELLTIYLEQTETLSSLEDLLQYGDYASWQNELIQSPDEEVQLFLQKYNYKEHLYRTPFVFESRSKEHQELSLIHI